MYINFSKNKAIIYSLIKTVRTNLFAKNLKFHKFATFN